MIRIPQVISVCYSTYQARTFSKIKWKSDRLYKMTQKYISQNDQNRWPIVREKMVQVKA